MKVVLDSNIIIADWHLGSPSFRILLEGSNQGKLDVYVPKVVIDEVCNKFEERLKQAQQKIDKELKTVKKLTEESFDNEVTDDFIEENTSQYRSQLIKKLKENKVSFLPYPKTSHKILSQKAMKKIKPFNSNEKGYRDSLIWKNVKSILTEDEQAISYPEVIFITNNYTDFSGDGDKIHSDLINELTEEEFDASSVELRRGLKEFNDTTTKLFFSQAESFRNRIKDGKIWDFDIKTPITNFLFDNYIGKELYHYQSRDEYEFDSSTVSGINDEDFELEITSVQKLNATEFILEVATEIDTEIDLFIEKYTNWMDMEPKVAIIDPDWNRHVMLASTNLNVPLSITLIVDADLEISSIEIDKIYDEYR